MSKQDTVQVAVKGGDGLVVLKFDRDINYLEMGPENAFDIAEAMTAAAFECKNGVKPVGPALKAELIEKHRMKLTQRLALMLNSARGDPMTSNGQLAKTMVDTCLAEIF